MNLYLMTTMDKYELPLAVTDTVEELGEIAGVNPRSIEQMLCKNKTHKGKKHPKYHKVEVEDDALC